MGMDNNIKILHSSGVRNLDVVRDDDGQVKVFGKVLSWYIYKENNKLCLYDPGGILKSGNYALFVDDEKQPQKVYKNIIVVRSFKEVVDILDLIGVMPKQLVLDYYLNTPNNYRYDYTGMDVLNVIDNYLGSGCLTMPVVNDATEPIFICDFISSDPSTDEKLSELLIRIMKKRYPKVSNKSNTHKRTISFFTK